VRVTGAGAGRAPAAVRRAVRLVLARERAGPAVIEVTMLSSQRMRALNRRAFGRDRATDVVSFGMRHGDTLVGDVYVCPAVARRSARAHGVPVGEELLRLVIHGTLHALGHRHPEGGAAARERSDMWRRQERYLATLRPGRAR
jgi:probable rRNA maturation factor